MDFFPQKVSKEIYFVLHNHHLKDDDQCENCGKDKFIMLYRLQDRSVSCTTWNIKENDDGKWYNFKEF